MTTMIEWFLFDRQTAVVCEKCGRAPQWFEVISAWMESHVCHVSREAKS